MRAPLELQSAKYKALLLVLLAYGNQTNRSYQLNDLQVPQTIAQTELLPVNSPESPFRRTIKRSVCRTAVDFLW